jgi:hypothetical protein
LGDAGAGGEREAGDTRRLAENPEDCSVGSRKDSLGRTRGDEHEAEYDATARSERHMEGLGRFRLSFPRFGLSRCWAALPQSRRPSPLQHPSDLGEDCSRGDGHELCMSSSETILAAARTIPPWSLGPSSDAFDDDDGAGLFQH